MRTTCQKCGSVFYRDPDENWKRLCLDCWKASKKHPVHVCTDDGIEAKLRADLEAWQRRAIRAEASLALHRCPKTVAQFTRDELMTLRRLAHPDKHQGSEAANRITQRLNEIIKEVQ